jgi:hypothetical protein
VRLAFAFALVLACSPKPENDTAGPSPSPSVVATPAPAPADAPPPAESIVFADRTSQAYVLLLEGESAKLPTRDELVQLVRRELGKEEPEVEVLVQYIGMDPKMAGPNDARLGGPGAPHDLLGLHVEALDAAGVKAAVPAAVLEDPILVRELSPAELASLPTRKSAILLRGDYRNERAVRGLRLLQALVRLVAADRKALVHDPDTGETLGVDAFTRRRLQAGLGNIADQIAIVPFPDAKHGEPWLRLATRGMRRFGSPDLELDGLPRDGKVLQDATFLLHGLAYQMARLAELDPSGYPLELTDDVEVSHADITRAYSRQQGAVPRCDACVGRVMLALRKREAEPHDPQSHVVVRVVAPKGEPDAADQSAWARRAIAKVLGPAS